MRWSRKRQRTRYWAGKGEFSLLFQAYLWFTSVASLRALGTRKPLAQMHAVVPASLQSWMYRSEGCVSPTNKRRRQCSNCTASLVWVRPGWTMACWPSHLNGGNPALGVRKGRQVRPLLLALSEVQRAGQYHPLCSSLGQRREKRPSLFKTAISYVFHMLSFYLFFKKH